MKLLTLRDYACDACESRIAIRGALPIFNFIPSGTAHGQGRINPTKGDAVMALDLLSEKGTPLDRQNITWREMASIPISKLDDDAFTRVRVILLIGIESEALRCQHGCGRMNGDLRLPLAKMRRIEQHQQTMVIWLLPPDQSPLETTIGYEQVAIEVTAALAMQEPDPYLAQLYRFGLLEDFDHLYRYSALLV